jgi:hypothetical protein
LATLPAIALAGVAIAAGAPTPFPGDPLLPGDTASMAFTVAATGRAASTHLVATHVHQSCDARVVATCPMHPGDVAQELQLSVSGPGGVLWRGSLADLEDGVTLPHSDLPPGHARTFGLDLTLPASANNSFQDQGFSATLTWTAEGAAGQPAGPTSGRTVGTGVLGEKVSRAGDTSNTDDSLPFSGADLVLPLLLAGAAIGVGSASVAAARRRRG